MAYVYGLGTESDFYIFYSVIKPPPPHKINLKTQRKLHDKNCMLLAKPKIFAVWSLLKRKGFLNPSLEQFFKIISLQISWPLIFYVSKWGVLLLEDNIKW